MNITVDLSSPLVVIPAALLLYLFVGGVVGGIAARGSDPDDKLGMGILCGVLWPVAVTIAPFVAIGMWIATAGKKR